VLHRRAQRGGRGRAGRARRGDLDRASGRVSYGKIPPGAVVVSGSMPAADGSHSLYCAVIVKTVDEKTRRKVGINALLRGAE